MNANKNGFTLIELSIVLVIIGLIIGSIVIGQGLIRNAQLQSVLTEESKLAQAITLFRNKYLGLPGDITNATAFWGDEGDCSGVSASWNTPRTVTCNGDGNANIGNDNPDGSRGAYPEMFRSVQQLADAGLIEGSYSGITGPGGSDDEHPGINTYPSKLSGGGWLPQSWSMASPSWYALTLQVVLNIHAAATASDAQSANLMTAVEALALDQKVDDGLPGTGNVVAGVSNAYSCTTTADASTALYNTTNNGVNCWLSFATGIQ